MGIPRGREHPHHHLRIRYPHLRQHADEGTVERPSRYDRRRGNVRPGACERKARPRGHPFPLSDSLSSTTTSLSLLLLLLNNLLGITVCLCATDGDRCKYYEHYIEKRVESNRVVNRT